MVEIEQVDRQSWDHWRERKRRQQEALLRQQQNATEEKWVDVARGAELLLYLLLLVGALYYLAETVKSNGHTPQENFAAFLFGLCLYVTLKPLGIWDVGDRLVRDVLFNWRGR